MDNNICAIENCTNKIHSKNLCNKHYLQMHRTGKIAKRTIRDNNIFRIYFRKAEMITFNIKTNIKAITVIDLKYLEQIQKHKWYCNIVKDCYYIITNINKEKVYLSQFIYTLQYGNYNKELFLTYTDKNTLNNTLDNLKLRTRSEMQEITKLPINNTSGHKGVKKLKCGKWEAGLHKNRKYVYLGLHDTIEEAIRSREEGELKYFVTRQ